MLPPWPFKSTIRRKPWRDQVVDQVAQQVEIGPWRGRQRAREIEMVMRVSQPQERGPDDPVTKLSGGSRHDLAEQHTVGEDWQMLAVLLHGRDRHDDWNVLRDCPHLGPAQVLKSQRDAPPSNGSCEPICSSTERPYVSARDRPV